MATASKESELPRNYEISSEEHLSKWEERKLIKKYHMVNAIDLTKSHMSILLEYYANNQYEDINEINNVYDDLIEALKVTIIQFDEDILGHIVLFLLTDDRIDLRPDQIPDFFRDVVRVYGKCCIIWDTHFTGKFSDPYNKLLTHKKDVRSFLLYFSLEVFAHKWVGEEPEFSYPQIIKAFLNDLQKLISKKMNLYFIEKIIFGISENIIPGLSSKCTHPMLAQIDKILLSYYPQVEKNWQKIVIEGEHHNLLFVSESKMAIILMTFVVDNFHEMSNWENKECLEQVDTDIKVHMLDIISCNLPSELIHDLILSSFDRIVSSNKSYDLLDNMFKLIYEFLSDISKLIINWINLISFEDFDYFGFELTVDSIQTYLFRLYIKTNDVNVTELIVNAVANEVNERHINNNLYKSIFRHLTDYTWDTTQNINAQVTNWFNNNQVWLAYVTNLLNEIYF